MTILFSLINSAALLWGGAVDFKKREIPNLVPLILMATGVLKGSFLIGRLIAVLCILMILWLASKLSSDEIPGGDFKLLCALAFSDGLLFLLGTLLLAGSGAVLCAVVQHEKISRNIPLCTYVAPSYILLKAYLLI